MRCCKCHEEGARPDLGRVVETRDGAMHWRCIPTYIRADEDLLAGFVGVSHATPRGPWLRRAIEWARRWWRGELCPICLRSVYLEQGAVSVRDQWTGRTYIAHRICNGGGDHAQHR